MTSLVVQNPKYIRHSCVGRANWYHYYPSFSPSFAYSLLKSAGLGRDAVVLDPWNGSGTTTSAACALGYQARGYDLNPVMVIAAKARLLNRTEKASLRPLGYEIIAKSQHIPVIPSSSDPLDQWMVPQSVFALRSLEKAVQMVLVDNAAYRFMIDRNAFGELSCIAAFYYTALFRTARSLMKRFYSSNPTWTKLPSFKSQRVRPHMQQICDVFTLNVSAMIREFDQDPFNDSDAYIRMDIGSSEALPLDNRSVDLVLTSPPYCTRIDYAVATRIELALLGYSQDAAFHALRRRLIGTSTVPAVPPHPTKLWGPTCLQFLSELCRHESKASHSYYYRNHLQYFNSISLSVSEIVRTMKKSATCVLVAQDSYYKELHNDLPQIISEIASNYGLMPTRRWDFPLSRTLAGINPGTKKYRKTFDAMESVLCFSKNH